MKTFMEKLISVVPRENQINWQKLEYTAFFHYGMNSFTDREWGTGKEDISLFSPQNLNTDQWCEILKKAEIKACIITAKHHDGFCLWDTAYTKHSVMHTPLQRDIVAELAASCEKYGIKLGVYLSPWDMHEPVYGSGEEYNNFFCGQLTELLTKYGKLYSVWFDGACGEGPNGRKQEYDWKRYYELIRMLQPEAVIAVCGPDVRWCGNEAGDCRESEWSVVPAEVFSQSNIMENSQKADDAEFRKQGLDQQTKDLGSRDVVRKAKNLIWYPSEVDVSIRPGWFYHEAEDHQVKAFDDLKRIYLNSVGGNSVLLLNIPPHKDGYITRFDEERLTELGDFIRGAFQHNYAQQAIVKAALTEEGYQAANIVKDDESCWKAVDYCDSCEIIIKLQKAELIHYIILQEQIRLSQRVEAFEIWAEIEDQGNLMIYSGTTVGYKKICEVAPTRITALKIVFKKFRVAPVIRFVGLY
ncbi:alpha-L-fucosidase [Anaerotaenia torta]|uniref:alpha-L-fucosidase n=1 Tax=Anaerotaenia torta TaxID=433293 RepID=UPI003D197E93